MKYLYSKFGAKKEYFVRTNVKKYLNILFGEDISKVSARIKFVPAKKQIVFEFFRGKGK